MAPTLPAAALAGTRCVGGVADCRACPRTSRIGRSPPSWPRVRSPADAGGRPPAGARALVELARDGARREWTFGEVAERSAAMAGALAARGVRRGDVVMTLIGNRPEWVLAMVACFRLGAVVLPCNEQLRAADLRVRLTAADPVLVLTDERNLAELDRAAPAADLAVVPDDEL